MKKCAALNHNSLLVDIINLLTLLFIPLKMIWWQWCLVLLLYPKLIDSFYYDILMEKVYCDNSPNYICKNITCRIRPVKRLVYNLSAGCDLPERADTVLLGIKLNYKTQVYRTFLIDVEENFCEYLIDNKRTTVMNLLVIDMLSKSNINLKCPVNKGAYWIRDYQINPRSMPPFLPSGQYRLDLHFTNKDKSKVYASTKIYFSVRPIGLNKGEMG